jgi:heterodisulfide reductase subunit C
MVRKIRLQAKNREFTRKISELSGEVVMLCEQCGICTGSCPMSAEMDITPSQMMRLVQLGQEAVLENKTFWVCASCYTCTVRCPRGIDPAKIAEALRQVKLRQAIDYIQIDEISSEEAKKLPSIALVAAFRKMTG